MSVLSTVCCALLSAVTAFTIVTAAGCGTDAKGVDDCRDIEQVRCAAAKNCGIVDNVAECQNFYRDQCLHGLAVTPPGAAAIKQCVDTIHAAGDCAALKGKDSQVSDCDEPPSSSSSGLKTCEIVSNPERTIECSFLMPNAGGSGSGGSGGSGGTGSGGTDSSGGTAAAAGATAESDAGGTAG